MLGGAVYGIYWIAMKNQGASGVALSKPISPDEPSTGNQSGDVVLVEYSDFQCPACKAYYPVVQQLLKEHGDRVHLVYRHFPLPQHKNAKPAAYAATSAGAQGKFWEMHDMLFEHQEDWADSNNAKTIFLGYAVSLGLNVAAFSAAFDNPNIATHVEEDFQSGIVSQVTGTPTFFLNGKKIESPSSYDEFTKLIPKGAAAN